MDSDITQILELSYKEFNVTMMNMAKLPVEKVDSIHNQMEIVAERRGEKFKPKRKCCESKVKLRMKNAFDRFISRQVSGNFTNGNTNVM